MARATKENIIYYSEIRGAAHIRTCMQVKQSAKSHRYEALINHPHQFRA